MYEVKQIIVKGIEIKKIKKIGNAALDLTFRI